MNRYRNRSGGLGGAIASFGASIAGIIMLLAFMVTPTVCWVVNVVQLVQCDWDNDKSWKGEIIHSIGLIPYASLVTVWFSEK